MEDDVVSAEGSVTSRGYTVNVDLMHAFDSVTTKSNNVAKNCRQRAIHDTIPVAYVGLSDMSYGKRPDTGYEVWTYTQQTTPDQFSQPMNATVSQYKTIDATPKSPQFDDHDMGFNKSTLTWKKGETTAPPNTMYRVDNPDGKVIIDYEMDNDVPIYYLYQDQEIEN